MNLAGVNFPAFKPYNGRVAFEIYVSGCDNHCIGCHNLEMQDFNYGSKLDVDDLIKQIKDAGKLVDVISFLGGDLLSQNENEAMEIVTKLKHKFKTLNFWLFTGTEFDNLPSWCLYYFDLIKCGKYDERLKQEGFPSSSNQRVYYKINFKDGDSPWRLS